MVVEDEVLDATVDGRRADSDAMLKDWGKRLYRPLGRPRVHVYRALYVRRTVVTRDATELDLLLQDLLAILISTSSDA
jgi:hypothetical protein